MKATLDHVENNAIRPMTETETLRPVGLAAGKFVVPDDFDEPLPDEILDAFEGR